MSHAFWPAASIHFRHFEPVVDAFSGKLIHAPGHDSRPPTASNRECACDPRNGATADRPTSSAPGSTRLSTSPLVKLVAAIGWPGLETHFGAGQTAFFTGDYRQSGRGAGASRAR